MAWFLLQSLSHSLIFVGFLLVNPVDACPQSPLMTPITPLDPL